MKLEVGMYVRTDKGRIGKVLTERYEYKDDYNQEIQFKNGVEDTWDMDWEDIIKTSHNIIDLIQENDFVNGSEVMEADWLNENGEYEEGLAFPMYATDDLEVIENWLPLRCVEIKSIVTKEQFESMSYKL